MGQVFWLKDYETGEYRPNGLANAKSVAVTRGNPLPVQLFNSEDEDPYRFEVSNDYLPPVAGQTITRMVKIPGIGTGAAYTAGDSFGGLIGLPGVFRPEKNSGTLTGLVLYDLDDEGLQIDVVFYSASHSPTADNSPNASADSVGMTALAVVEVNYFVDMVNWQLGYPSTGATGLPQWIKGDGTDLYIHCVTRGVHNIAAGSEPWLRFVFVPD